uniref:Uncharacterized protein n=1 Tax=mine drainage metagenome TaxID=410659 RepID=E6PNK5_9ZZZZ
MAVLKQKQTTKTTPLTVRIASELHAQVQALQRDADAAGFIFDLADLCEKALAAAVKSARAELANAGVERAAHDRQQATA